MEMYGLARDDSKKVEIYTDGGARGNPGNAAIGIIMLEEGNVFYKCGEFIGKATNNQAEYSALIKALEVARSLSCGELTVYSDSLLMIQQLKGLYRVRSKNLMQLYYRVKALEESFKKVKYNYVYRENIYISRADKLVNDILDKVKGKSCINI